MYVFLRKSEWGTKESHEIEWKDETIERKVRVEPVADVKGAKEGRAKMTVKEDDLDISI